MHKLTGLLIIPTLILTFCGCTQKASRSTPKDAMFCDNIADQVQTVEQLHVTPGTTALTDQTDPVLSDERTYAMWFPYVDYAETLAQKDAASFRSAMQGRFSQAADMGINTVFLHVRAYQDAYYPSTLFPMGSYAEDIDFDPLEIMIEEAHRLSLSVHAWINPLRCPDDAGMAAMDEKYPVASWYADTEKNGSYLGKVDDHWWLNPAYPEVRQLITEGVAEILRNYAVDGIHLDDYFYPTTDPSFDAAAFQESGSSDLSAFRLEQTNALMHELYKTVHQIQPKAILSVSPQGTMRGNYDSQYADVRTWASQPGYCDMLIPQIYFGFENETAPFADTVSLWTSIATREEVSLVVGIGTHKVGKEDIWAGSGSAEWQNHLDIPSRQVEFLQSLDRVNGIAIYDYSTTFSPDTASESMAQQVLAITEMLHESP